MITIELETYDQIYKIRGGSAGLVKIIPATGLVDAELSPIKLIEIFGDTERRKAIVSVLLDEGRFDPKPDLSTDRKKEAFIADTARDLDTSWIINLIANLASEMNLASTGLAAAVPAIAPQSELIQEVAIAQTELPLAAIATSNIAEGE
jgi:hypothetical protein